MWQHRLAFVLIVLASVAGAQASERRSTAPASTQPTWSGFYAGLHAGYGFGSHLRGAADVFDPLGLTPTPVGVLGGLNLGFNAQLDRLVFGIEGDFAFSGVQGRRSVEAGAAAGNVVITGQFTTRAQLNWLATLRGRAGVTMDRGLIYVTGGLAVGEARGAIDFNGTLTINGVAVNAAAGLASTSTHVGWTIGTGAEFFVDRNWTIKAEYIYVDLPNRPYFAGTGADLDIGLRTHILRAGFNYRF